MIVAARWGLSADAYMARYSYPELRLHVEAFTKEALLPIAPLLAGLRGGKHTGPRAGGRDLSAMPRWWRAKPGVEYTVVPPDASRGDLAAIANKFHLADMAPPARGGA